VFLWRNQYVVIVRYHQLVPKRARWFGVCGAVRSYARTPRPLREPLTSTVHVLCVSVRSFAMRSYARKPIPQRMDLRERKHASQSLPGESVLGMQSQRAQVHGMSLLSCHSSPSSPSSPDGFSHKPSQPMGSPTNPPIDSLSRDSPTSQPMDSLTSIPMDSPTSQPMHSPMSRPMHSPTSRPMHSPTSQPMHSPTSRPMHSPTSQHLTINFDDGNQW